MNKLKLILAVTAIASVISALPASASDKGPAFFPTDVLGKYVGAVSVNYTYSTADMDAVFTTAGVSSAAKLNAESNLFEWKAQLGLGNGLQIGASQKFEAKGQTASAPGGLPFSVSDYNGGYNPAFEIAWDPMRPCYAKEPFQVLFSYKVKPKGIASDHAPDDFTEHNGSVMFSYKLANMKLRPYIGYNHTHYGESLLGDPGHTNSVLSGVEYGATKRLKLNLAYSAVLSSGSSYAGTNTTNNIGASAEYKTHFVKAFGLYLKPFFNAGLSGGRSYNGALAGVDSINTGSVVVYSTGLTVKSVF